MLRDAQNYKTPARHYVETRGAPHVRAYTEDACAYTEDAGSYGKGNKLFCGA